MTETEPSQDDFVNAFETAFARLQVVIEEACAGAPGWPQGVARGIRAGLDLAADDPAAARVLAVEALAHGPRGTARYERLVRYLAELLEPGREQCRHAESLPGIVERALASGVTTMVSQRLDEGREEELRKLAPEVIQFVLTPYLDSDAAARTAVSDESAAD
jgi:hypothetical protein